MFGSSKGWLPHEEDKPRERVAVRLDRALSMQTKFLSCCSPWRNREGVGTVFRGVHHGQVGLSLGWKISLQVQISGRHVQAQE